MPGAEAPFARFSRSWREVGCGCWIWTKSFAQNGYGQLKVFGKMTAAHRFAFELYKGPIPAGGHILHSCDNKACVNPAHLRCGTHQENMREAAERGRMRSGSRHHNFGSRQSRPRQSNRVRVLGQEFPSQKQAETALGLGSGTVRYWLRTNSDKAQLLSKGELNGQR